MASVMFDGKPLTPDVVIDETWFSDPTYCESIKHWYLYAKTIAEKAVWKFAEESGIDIVIIHPGFVIGPFLQPTLNVTVEVILNYVNGKLFLSALSLNVMISNMFILCESWVPCMEEKHFLMKFTDLLMLHVASAHIQAFEQASGNS
ncbi:phenylacetaldehyde reductase-like [Manihot esculenta]|uniref:Uncharacterized protein n=1 Tax=Manihot esculenta TaxID=3983 RepID=A0ACB7HEU8_MANES|nr:phenylacetaldehyde reductase-like [Manihot esculenta]KAG8650474.1 hypothetical protein MANES_07G045501v8 [Manihot esculenta]